MSVIDNSLLLTAPAGGGSYQVSRSLRFNSGDSSYCGRVPASAGNRTTWSFSAWIKRSQLGAVQRVFTGANATNDDNWTAIFFNSSDQLVIGGYTSLFRISNSVYRDCSAWYHLLVTADLGNGANALKFRAWINNSEVTWSSTGTNPSTTGVNSANNHTIGAEQSPNNGGVGSYFNGYLAECIFLDGIATDPSSFTTTDLTTGQLVPKAYGGSYGTNGFRLAFDSYATTAALGTDTSGNGNTWTVNNFSVNAGTPVSVASATGGTPVLNTTDTYGATLGSGVRTDAYASSLVLDLPLTAQGGRSITDDVSPSGRTSGAKTFTNSGVSASTSVSKFYGGSAVFANPSTRMTTPTSSDFALGATYTIECWVYRTSSSRGFIVGDYTNVNQPLPSWSFELQSASSINFTLIYANASLLYDSYSWNYTNYNVWDHVALVRNGSGDPVLYVNGVLQGAPSYGGNAGKVNVISSSTQELSVGGVLGSYAFNGNIQDLRVYTGAAKYTANFTVPASSLQLATVAAGNDSLVDTPTSYGTDTGVGGEVRGNYATWNPLLSPAAASYSNGNLEGTTSSSGNMLGSTIAVSSGKFYCEITPTVTPCSIGIVRPGVVIEVGSTTTSYSYVSGGSKNTNNSLSSYGSSYSANDVIGIALDMDNGTITFYKNGTSQGTAFTSLTGEFCFAISRYSPTQVSAIANFGQRAFAYTAPSGFKALVDTNLPAPVVAKPSSLFDVVTYVGNGASTKTVSGLAFSPDLVWTKARSQAYGQNWYDVIRGGGKVLRSDLTDSELTNSSEGYVSSFTSDGYVGTAGSNSAKNVNENGTSYVAWAWDAGTSTVTNNSGSISSQVRANPTAGFSVVTWAGPGGGTSTVGHGLGVIPGMVIVKGRGSAPVGNWWVTHSAMNQSNPSGFSDYLVLNDTSAKVPGTYDVFRPHTSSVISLGADGVVSSSTAYVAYCFAPVSGYSSFGSYVGNGSSTDNTFVYTGMRPRFVMLKRSDSTGNWVIWDAVRNSYNVANSILLPNSSAAEYSPDAKIDILSNGFKVRDNSSDSGTNAATYIYAAFAESPFQYARAR